MPSVSLERGDDVVSRDVNNEEVRVALRGTRDVFEFSVRCGGVGKHESEDFDVAVSNEADDE